MLWNEFWLMSLLWKPLHEPVTVNTEKCHRGHLLFDVKHDSWMMIFAVRLCCVTAVLMWPGINRWDDCVSYNYTITEILSHTIMSFCRACFVAFVNFNAPFISCSRKLALFIIWSLWHRSSLISCKVLEWKNPFSKKIFLINQPVKRHFYP